MCVSCLECMCVCDALECVRVNAIAIKWKLEMTLSQLTVCLCVKVMAIETTSMEFLGLLC